MGGGGTVRRVSGAVASAATVLVVVLVGSFVLVVGGRIGSPGPSATQTSAATDAPVAVGTTPSEPPSTGPTIDQTPGPTEPPSSEPTSEPTPDPTEEASPTPSRTPKPTPRVTPKPKPQPNPNPTPTIYNVSGGFGETIANHGLTARAVLVPLPDWAKTANCSTGPTDETIAEEVTVTWPGHTRLGGIGFSVGGPDGWGAILTEFPMGNEKSGVPVVIAICHVASSGLKTLIQYSPDGGDPPVVYNWHIG